MLYTITILFFALLAISYFDINKLEKREITLTKECERLKRENKELKLQLKVERKHI